MFWNRSCDCSVYTTSDGSTPAQMFQSCADPEGGGQGVRNPPPPLKNCKNIGFLSNSGLDPLKITKLPSQNSMLGHNHHNSFRWRADGGRLIVVFGSSHPSSTKKKKLVKVGPPLTKFSGSTHASALDFCSVCLEEREQLSQVGPSR